MTSKVEVWQEDASVIETADTLYKRYVEQMTANQEHRLASMAMDLQQRLMKDNGTFNGSLVVSSVQHDDTITTRAVLTYEE